MKILVLGDTSLFQELQEKLGDSHDYLHVSESTELSERIQTDVAIDFTIDESPDNLVELLQRVEATHYLVNVIKSSLTEMSFYTGPLPANITGFNGLPGFVNRETWEVTGPNPEEILKALSVDFRKVEDRVGMVTPRVICMIINEAYYTVQEGTATREDIDLGMKLGTGYPFGPFEWADRIGLGHVYELLEALWEDTREERYKICPLLKREYMQTQMN
jgi:3-hydroxybutyryl-CoA dehydrogenase